MVVGVDILELGLDPEGAKEVEGVIAQVTALPGDQDNGSGSGHGPDDGSGCGYEAGGSKSVSPASIAGPESPFRRSMASTRSRGSSAG